MGSARVRRIGVAQARLCGPLAIVLAIGLSGCSTEMFETRLADIKTSLKSYGLEVHKSKVMYVFRF